jgi:tetratricopeptide (TPR) repeat protein
VRNFRAVLLAGAALWALPAFAADALKFGPPPPWATEVPIPAAKATDAPIAILLEDEQIALDPGKITTFRQGALKIQNPQGLAAGNLSLVWDPSRDTVTVNKLHVIRDGKVIDVLASGQTFTILRRETNLDAAMLDGTLTANIQPEGLQEGDIIVMAATVEHSDPVLKGHVEATFASWNGLPMASGHASVNWPAQIKVNVRKSASLPEPRKSVHDGRTVLELAATGIQPIIPPAGAPARFQIGRFAEASDFASWGDLAMLVMPLYRDASVVPGSGPLHDEVERIRAGSKDPMLRAKQALALVEDRVRYLALGMGQGGYVPASAETTWSRRFGDCKAKTALLLAMLRSLGIDSEPVLVRPETGDLIADRVPMMSLFDHVLVRAHIAGKDYWLDGTRTGDTDIDSIQVPDFGWGLPLVENAQLVHLVPKPLDTPNVERRVNIDASKGVFAPAETTIEETYRGDNAVDLNIAYSALTADQRDEGMRNKARGYFDSFTITSSSLHFDKAKRTLDLTIKGTAKLSWKDSWLHVPTSSIGFDPDFDRVAGPLHDVPLTVSHPRFAKEVAIIKLPVGFAAQQKLEPAVHEMLAGVEYARTETVNGDVLTVDSSERSVMPEVPYSEAVAAEPRLRALSKDDVYVSLADNYRPTDVDFAAIQQVIPASAEDYFRRADAYLSRRKTDEALSDLSAGLALDPKDVGALGKRVYIYTQKRDYANAEKDIAAVQALDPSNPALPGAQAMVAEGKGDYSACILGYSKILERQPTRSYALAHRAMCEASSGNDQAALADSAAALKISPKMIDMRMLRANIFMHQGKRDLVAAEADAMTKDNPTSDYAWVGAARTYAALGQRDRAMKAFDRALAIKPYAYIYDNRSAVRLRSDVSGRMADLDAALKLEPNDATALQEKAQLLSEVGNIEGALAILDRAKPDPDDQYTQQLRAILLYKAGRTAEAEKLFTDIRAKTTGAMGLNNLCWAKATAGILLESALLDCRDALKLNPDIGGYEDSLGMVLLRLGKFDDALSAYNAAIAKRVGATSLMGRAMVYTRKGDRARANADAAAARKLDAQIDVIFAGFGLKP